jgi:hypothetical protein
MYKILSIGSASVFLIAFVLFDYEYKHVPTKPTLTVQERKEES